MTHQLSIVKFISKWLLVATIVGLLVGSASALFLVTLNWVTVYREANAWLLFLLPLGGLLVGFIYHYWGQTVVKGNNQLIEEIQNPTETIPFKMMPLVLLTTLITHIVGGSAGREGTAVQMGGAIADTLWKPLKFIGIKRQFVLMMGVSAGFSAVFGTPLAGTIFALEVAVIGIISYEAILPCLLAALLADYTCQEIWQVGHTHYGIETIPILSISRLLWAMLAGILFGLAAMAFAKLMHFWRNLFNTTIAYPPFRPLVGGILLGLLCWFVGTRYMGLGVPIIVASFHEQLPWYDSFGKVFFTALTLGSGFKGGEVTPLFYIGATLGNALANVIPLPMA
jgi:H+/Cl- antiporter ClcA